MRKKILSLLLAMICLFGAVCPGAALAADDFFDQEKYLEARASHKEANRYKTDVTLSEKEEALDRKLAVWKAEYIDSCDGKVPYDMPVLTDGNIWNSKLYQFCEALPKGSDLHIHGMALMPFDELLSFIESRDELFIGTGERNRYYLAFHEDPAEAAEDEFPVLEALELGLINLDDLRVQWTVLGADDYDGTVWDWFETLFNKHMALSNTPELIEAYYRNAFRYYCGNNIFHLEVRQLFFGSHDEALANAKAIRNAYYEVRKEYPDFIASVVGTGLKYTTLDRSLTDTLLDNALYIRENLKDDFDPDNIHEFLIGIDLVNEEDKSRPLIEFADQLDGIKKENPDLHIMLHAGESLYADSDNVIDAYLLGAERIGHGLNLYRFPKIMDLVCEDGICLEVCPISNQVLEYVEDLRGHPATEYLKRGLPISICSDDPAYLEHATLTDDFFAAIVCWDLGLAEIKQLCLNSITCSGMDDLQREELMQSWQKQWDTFLNDLEAGV